MRWKDITQTVTCVCACQSQLPGENLGSVRDFSCQHGKLLFSAASRSKDLLCGVKIAACVSSKREMHERQVHPVEKPT